MQKHRKENQRGSRPPHNDNLKEFGFTQDGINQQFKNYL